MVMKESLDNSSLATSCGKTGASCCKDGFIFLPRAEYEAILNHLVCKPNDLKEFTDRIKDHGDFLLYNQQQRCQFLMPDERCELHPLGIKPTECFWWPAHVYLADDGALEIRVATCCSGCAHLTEESHHIEVVAQQAKTIGLPVLTNFRRTHSYGKDYRVVKRI